MASAPPNPLGMSDEEFLNQNGPAEEQSQNAVQEENPLEPNANPENQEENDGGSNSVEETQQEEDKKTLIEGSQENQEVDGKAPAVNSADASAIDEKDGLDPSKVEEPKDSKDPASLSGSSESEITPDYQAFHDQIMAPFKANGKEIKLKDATEAIQLMQMGANYTRKLQQMAPQRKILTMLGNHGLLDESKLSFFIALDKKDPEAIKKLIMESGIDPLDIDTKIEPAYQEGSYQVSDQEVTFRTHLDELTSTDSGKQTLKTINDDWDQASKDLLWQHPEVFPIIQTHRDTGIYDQITAEMDRRRTLGQLLPTTPFLEAYRTIGDELHESGQFKPDQRVNEPGSKPAASVEKPAVVIAEARPATPKPIVDNSDKAGAASPSRNAPGKGKETTNFLAMSDEDFLKANNLDGRV